MYVFFCIFISFNIDDYIRIFYIFITYYKYNHETYIKTYDDFY